MESPPEPASVTPSPPAPPPPLRPEDERLLATLIHLCGLLWVLGIPGIVGVLLIWLLKRDQSAFVDHHGKEATNFQISLLVYGVAIAGVAVIGFVLTIVLVGFLLFIPAILASVALVILQVVTAILGAIEANRGGYYRYPLTIRFIR
ncbi:MAG TPA: DUF4870 domain-containing protein [Planctomycetota bacterium]|nr:DUF4870 domain-containing protein [Planctomycetota bacterium]